MSAVAHRLRAIASLPLVRNGVFLVLSQGTNLALGFAFWVLASRLFPIDDVGIAAATISLISLASTFGSAGVGNALVLELRDRSGLERGQTLAAGIVLSVALSTAAACLLLLLAGRIAPSLGTLATTPMLAALCLVGAISMALGEVGDRVLVAARQAGHSVTRATVVGIGRVAIVVAGVGLGWRGLVVGWVVATAASLPLAIRFARLASPDNVPRFGGSIGRARDLVRHVSINNAISIANLAPQYVLPLIIIAVLTARDAAIATNVWRIAGVMFVISVAMSTSLYAEGAHRPDRLREAGLRTTKIIAMVLVPAIIGVALLGRTVLSVFGTEYEEGYALLMVLAIASIPDAVTNVSVAVYRCQQRLGMAALLTIAIATCIIAYSLVLVQVFGLIGVGLGWLLAQATGCAIVTVERLRRRRARVA